MDQALLELVLAGIFGCLIVAINRKRSNKLQSFFVIEGAIIIALSTLLIVITVIQGILN